MAATSPIAVASRASAIPGATTARLVVCCLEMPMKLFMMPHTVPNRPTKGAIAPVVANTPVPRVMRRPAAASRRSSREAMRSLTPAGLARSPDISSSRIAASAAVSRWRHPLKRRAASASERHCAKASTCLRKALLVATSSKPLARAAVHVATEASASRTITALTTMAAVENMPHGDRSLGSSDSEAEDAAVVGSGAAPSGFADGPAFRSGAATPTAGSVGAAVCATVATVSAPTSAVATASAAASLESRAIIVIPFDWRLEAAGSDADGLDAHRAPARRANAWVTAPATARGRIRVAARTGARRRRCPCRRGSRKSSPAR